jgi:hypothetical protein
MFGRKEKIMKLILSSLFAACILFTVSCGKQNSSSPIEKGTVVSGMLWSGPSGRTRSGNQIPAGTKVRIYSTYTVLIDDQGVKQIVPSDYITELKYK